MKRRILWQFLIGIFVLYALFLVGPVDADQAAVEKALCAKAELRVPVDCKTFAGVKITLQNLSDGESICWFSSFEQGTELGNIEIGPLWMRTVTLERQNEQKRVEFACKNRDEVLIHVDKGKILVKVEQKK